MLGSGRTKVVAVADPEEDTMAEDFNLSTQSIRRYPMMVMSLHKVLSLTRLEQHQVFKERGELVEYIRMGCRSYLRVTNGYHVPILIQTW
jgi:hypothetical protein